MLLSARANPTAKDKKGRTPADYATIAPGVWPFFEGTYWLARAVHYAKWSHVG